MSVWPVLAKESVPTLHTTEGELVCVRLFAESRSLEDVLDVLASVPFPVNPEIRHGSPFTTVEFPAYVNRLRDVRDALDGAGLFECRMEAANMLTLLQ